MLTIHGARGSMSVAGPHVTRFGGNTTCYHIDAGDGRYIIVDCGTGLRRLEAEHGEFDPGSEFIVLLTHYHWDHIQGLPFFGPLFERQNRFTFYGPADPDRGIADLIGEAFCPPWFPVSFSDVEAAKTFVTVDDEPFTVSGLDILPARLNHPQGVCAYRITHGDRTLVIATDHEAGEQEKDATLRELAEEADVLMHDAQYTPTEYADLYQGWGHSTWQHAVDTAIDARVDRLVLVSHDPGRSDDAIQGIVTEAKARFENVAAAFEGMTIRL